MNAGQLPARRQTEKCSDAVLIWVFLAHAFKYQGHFPKRLEIEALFNVRSLARFRPLAGS